MNTTGQVVPESYMVPCVELKSVKPGIGKTRMCPFYQKGKCFFPDSCNFAHDITELNEPLAYKNKDNIRNRLQNQCGINASNASRVVSPSSELLASPLSRTPMMCVQPNSYSYCLQSTYPDLVLSESHFNATGYGNVNPNWKKSVPNVSGSHHHNIGVNNYNSNGSSNGSTSAIGNGDGNKNSNMTNPLSLMSSPYMHVGTPNMNPITTNVNVNNRTPITPAPGKNSNRLFIPLPRHGDSNENPSTNINGQVMNNVPNATSNKLYSPSTVSHSHGGLMPALSPLSGMHQKYFSPPSKMQHNTFASPYNNTMPSTVPPFDEHSSPFLPELLPPSYASPVLRSAARVDDSVPPGDWAQCIGSNAVLLASNDKQSNKNFSPSPSPSPILGVGIGKNFTGGNNTSPFKLSPHQNPSPSPPYTNSSPVFNTNGGCNNGSTCSQSSSSCNQNNCCSGNSCCTTTANTPQHYHSVSHNLSQSHHSIPITQHSHVNVQGAGSHSHVNVQSNASLNHVNGSHGHVSVSSNGHANVQGNGHVTVQGNGSPPHGVLMGHNAASGPQGNGGHLLHKNMVYHPASSPVREYVERERSLLNSNFSLTDEYMLKRSPMFTSIDNSLMSPTLSPTLSGRHHPNSGANTSTNNNNACINSSNPNTTQNGNNRCYFSPVQSYSKDGIMGACLSPTTSGKNFSVSSPAFYGNNFAMTSPLMEAQPSPSYHAMDYDSRPVLPLMESHGKGSNAEGISGGPCSIFATLGAAVEDGSFEKKIFSEMNSPMSTPNTNVGERAQLSSVALSSHSQSTSQIHMSPPSYSPNPHSIGDASFTHALIKLLDENSE